MQSGESISIVNSIVKISCYKLSQTIIKSSTEIGWECSNNWTKFLFDKIDHCEMGGQFDCTNCVLEDMFFPNTNAIEMNWEDILTRWEYTHKNAKHLYGV